MKLGPDIVELTGLRTVEGEPVRLRRPDRARLTHLQFRRFAACPICNLHLQSVVARHAEITASSIHEVVVFHQRRRNCERTPAICRSMSLLIRTRSCTRNWVEASLRRCLTRERRHPLRNMLRPAWDPPGR